MSEAENQATFGACFTQHGHGHNYTLETSVSGPIDPETGMILNLSTLDNFLKTAITSIDGKHLNYEVPEFKKKVPTTENLLLYLKEKLEPLVKAESPNVEFCKIRLYEDPSLWVEWAK